MVDIPGNNTTTKTITVGGTVQDTLEVAGDHDWIRINLTAGQEITVALNAITSTLDPYLRILDQNGNLLWENDDINPGVNLNSLLSFQATYTGVYYIDVGSYDSQSNQGETGDYQLTVTPYQAPPIWTNDQIATQLASGYWGDGIHRFVLDQTRTLTVNITGLTPAGQTLARAALQTWSEITGITFQETSGTAQITFTDDDPDGGAFTESTYSGANISSSLVNVDVSWLQQYGSAIGGYAYHAYLHEIGHALGLGHAGNYNTTADYPYDALYQNDAWPNSIMSYFSQTENTYFENQGFTDAFVVTPMVADILAIQQLYGLSTNTRSGDTTYGPTGNAGSPYTLTNAAYTIFDTGGIDTIDFSTNSGSGIQVAVTINLNPETFSSIGGEFGNVSIARGTIIENAIGGIRADTLIGNSVGNTLTGSAGADTLTGGLGNDLFRDTIADHNGDTITDFGVGDAIVFTNASLGSFTFNLTGSTLNYSGGSLTLSSAVNGTIVASAAPGGGVQLTIQQAIVQDARNDFNGDGRSDILWRETNGEIVNWLGQANGGFADNYFNSYRSIPTSWSVEGVGDFNGDGRDDVLWRDTTGLTVNWLGQSNGGLADNYANSVLNVPTNWQVQGIGDFNGDGRDDVLWRDNNGTTVNWLGQANGGFADNYANSYLSVPTSWQVAGVGDFNGDGRDDILWRNSNGLTVDWLGQANGGFTDNYANSLVNIPTSWQIEGVGDFNGDGRDDILWRDNGGTVVTWLGQANGGFADNYNNSVASVPVAWQVVSIGDFNGDGRDDILWRHTNGTIVDWLGQANGGFADNYSNSAFFIPTNWHVQAPDIL